MAGKRRQRDKYYLSMKVNRWEWLETAGGVKLIPGNLASEGFLEAFGTLREFGKACPGEEPQVMHVVKRVSVKENPLGRS